jgi:hypothetical protein
MKTSTFEPHAAESYPTFWEPIVVDVPAPVADPEALAVVVERDAYLEFVNVTEDAPQPARADRD